MTTWQDALALWKPTLRSEYTKRAWGTAVSLFFRWGGEELDHVDADLLQSYVMYLAGRTNMVPKLDGHLTWGTVNKYLLALKLFFKFCVRKGWSALMVGELDETLKSWPAQVARPYLILDEEEIKAMMAAALSLRDRCMLALGLFAGLRNMEISNLLVGQVGKDEEGAYVVVKGKGNKEAPVSISDDLYALLRAYIANRAPTERMWHVSIGTTLVMVRRTARRACIAKRITVHSLRQTYAYRLFKHEVPVLVISKMLRHSNLAVTTGYLAHLSRQETARYAPSFPVGLVSER